LTVEKIFLEDLFMSDFKKETIYFIVIDRFFDGDPDNNKGKEDELFDETKTDWFKYWGGDIRGIIKKLDYLKGMGISAIWITPVFHQIDCAIGKEGQKIAPYHGYWAKDFKRIDEHIVDTDDDISAFKHNKTVFDELIKEMHKRGMKLILDIVCNHSSPHIEGGRGELYDDGVLIASYDEDKGDWYHHLGEVRNWNDLSQVQNSDLCGLSDFNEESYSYRQYIKESMKMWLSKGVDAFRVDTVKHMPIWFWQEFTTDMLTHKPGTFMFGEWFQGGVWDSNSVNFANKSGMTIIDFSLRQAVDDVFARNYYQGFQEIVDVLNRDGEFIDANELITFVDNHDMPRFLSVKNDPERLRLSIDFIMVARGIPCIYYGSEQYLHNDTNLGNDPYNRPMMEKWEITTPNYKDITKLSKLRRENPAVQKGSTFHHYVSSDIYVFSRSYMGNYCFVAINKGDQAWVKISGCPLPDGIYKEIITEKEISMQKGNVQLLLEKNDFQVFSFITNPISANTIINFHLNGYKTTYGENVYITGDCDELGKWDKEKAIKLEYINSGTWSIDIPFDKSRGKFINYKYLLKGSDKLLRENSIGRKKFVPQKGYEIWKDIWGF
jgi:cyclomaltodextrin glucanotransferase